MMRKAVLVIVALAAAALMMTAGAPAAARPMQVNLDDVMNMTTCPIEVVMNDIKERVPRLVKEIKCAATTQEKWCAERNIRNECCGGSMQPARHRRHAPRREMACKEVTDSVLVYYKDIKRHRKETFSVGCVCAIRDVQSAKSVA